jgi:drug/metabolite transporter (DMT)-like permease
MIYKVIAYKIEQRDQLAPRSFKEVAFGNFYDFKKQKYDDYYLKNQLLRILITMTSLYCAVKSIHYANLANINFGIISCCFIVSIIINCSCGYFFFQEKMNVKVILGIAVTISGIIWISLAKGQ